MKSARIVKLAVAAALSAVFGFIAHSAEDSAKVAWMLQTNLLENSSAEAAKDLPKVLVLGDSISMGYTPFLKRQLAGVADVRRPKCNCGATQFYLRERGGMKSWVGTNKWDVITVNAGIWDICYMKGSVTGCDHYWGPGKNKELAKLAPIPRGTAIRKLGYRVRTPILEYMANLRKILTYLKSTGATVIFPLTTPAVGYQVDDRCGLFRVYNEVAQAVCDELGVKTLDFY
ncbi:MAG: SGNH/GDSL hydrolase family protein, partial [Kiritimatiellae bacterium]|nr:SGNH/GDSL hydrolase family protein [Kiritimatiellia bacterium]